MDFNLVFFFYGLAFFSLGLSMVLEAGRFPLLAEARASALLAAFGLLCGFYEWLELFVVWQPEWVYQHLYQFEWLRLGWLELTFGLLILFGLRMLQPSKQLSGVEILYWAGAVAMDAAVILFVALFFRSYRTDWMLYTEIIIRYSLGLPSALLAGFALNRQALLSRQQGLPRATPGLRIAGYGFYIYAFTQLFDQPLNFFPVNILNSTTFSAVFGLPVQVVRAALAVFITFGLVQAMQAAEMERQRQFAAAQQARLDALQQIQQETVQREALRQEFLRHTVQAQEEERARIARELHDESSQLLTAFSLQLATLRQVTNRNPKAQTQIAQLQSLTRQISQGIYRLVRDLRPLHIDELGLAASLQWLAEQASQRLNLDVQVEITGPSQRLPSLVETAVFRVAQEALTNVARHAGVGQARLEFLFEDRQVTLRIIDQGVGMKVPPPAGTTPSGWGITGMRERAESIGGDLQIYSNPGQGAVVELRLPFSPAQTSSVETLIIADTLQETENGPHQAYAR